MKYVIARTILLDAAKSAKERIDHSLKTNDRKFTELREDLDVYIQCLSAADELCKNGGPV